MLDLGMWTGNFYTEGGEERGGGKMAGRAWEMESLHFVFSFQLVSLRHTILKFEFVFLMQCGREGRISRFIWLFSSKRYRFFRVVNSAQSWRVKVHTYYPSRISMPLCVCVCIESHPSRMLIDNRAVVKKVCVCKINVQASHNDTNK